MVENSLRLIAHIPVLVREVFGNAPLFEQAMNEAFNNIFNKDIPKISVPRMLAVYLDQLQKVRLVSNEFYCFFLGFEALGGVFSGRIEDIR
jgi:hypothetical protein